MKLYPMKFIPIYQEKIWGGSALRTLFGRNLSNDKIGESWELSSLTPGASVIQNGEYAGKTLNELTALAPQQFFGSRSLQGTTLFPLLIKILDANDKLSVQVHPNDAYASLLEAGQGKTEAWYVLQAQTGAEIIYGLKANTSKADFILAMEHHILDVLQKIPVKTGDMVYVPAGRVHALCGGVVVYEVQQTSDITYRLYDYDRVEAHGKTRQLHVDKAVQVINFNEQVDTDFAKTKLESPYFSMEKVTLDGILELDLADRFMILCVINGNGEIASVTGSEEICQGETILIPACLEKISINGKIEFLKIR